MTDPRGRCPGCGKPHFSTPEELAAYAEEVERLRGSVPVPMATETETEAET